MLGQTKLFSKVLASGIKPINRGFATHTIKVIDATPENTKEYGIFIGEEVETKVSIPFYKGSVIEGQNLPFQYFEKAVVRTAQILPVPKPTVSWLERHTRLSQLFVGMGSSSFVLVLGKPDPEGKVPKLSEVKAFRFPPALGIMLHTNTWHDFPIAWDKPVTVMTMNSAEVVEALIQQQEPGEMNRGDVYKLNLKDRLGGDIALEGFPRP